MTKKLMNHHLIVNYLIFLIIVLVIYLKIHLWKFSEVSGNFWIKVILGIFIIVALILFFEHLREKQK